MRRNTNKRRWGMKIRREKSRGGGNKEKGKEKDERVEIGYAHQHTSISSGGAGQGARRGMGAARHNSKSCRVLMCVSLASNKRCNSSSSRSVALHDHAAEGGRRRRKTERE